MLMNRARSWTSYVTITIGALAAPISAAHSDPATTLHYAANGNFDANGNYLSGPDGFNVADVGGAWELSYLPARVKALVYIGQCNGADTTFMNTVKPFIGNSNLFGFYLMDEPDPTGQYAPVCTAANLKAESDWVHNHVTGAKTFIVLMNLGSPTNPTYQNTYNSANTDIDLFGLDPYPCRPQFNGCNFSVISAAVNAAKAWGITQGQIVPVYQAFGGGGYASWLVPTVNQEKTILSTWGQFVPGPVFDYAYSWGVQSHDTAIANSPALQQVFATHNGVSAPAVVPSPGASSRSR